MANLDEQNVNEETGEMEEEAKMRPIWFFVGLVLLAMGFVIVLNGIYYLFNPSASDAVLSELHPDLWWGGIMFISGAIFLWTTRNATV